MVARWSTLVVWALVGAGALFWGLRLFASAPVAPPGTAVAINGPAVRGDLTRLLGADPPPVPAAAEPPPDARFQLIGVVTPRAAAFAREGLALIAVDGKPPKAFRVGAVVDGGTVLKSVAARGAMLGPRDGAPQVTLNLAPLAAAATGTLPTGATADANPGGMSPVGPSAVPGRPRIGAHSPRPMVAPSTAPPTDGPAPADEHGLQTR